MATPTALWIRELAEAMAYDTAEVRCSALKAIARRASTLPHEILYEVADIFSTDKTDSSVV